MGTPHTATKRGRKVHVILKTGEMFVDRFVERTRNKTVILENRGRLSVGEIRAFSDFHLQKFVRG